MIPQKIHYCWFGRGEKSKLAKRCIASWKKHCPDYEIIEWNEDNFDIAAYPYAAYCYRQRKWAFLSDFVRLVVVEAHGGLYFDTDVELPDYEHLTRPLVEVFTLDSATCAACTYMMGAAVAAKEQFGDAIDMVEYKFTVKENIARCIRMGVKNLPSIYINGKLKFSSLIPSREELEQAIREVL